MSDFDAATPLVMATFKTVHGFNLNRGTRLHIVDEPSVAGEVTEAMARRLFKSRIAVPADAFRPTPVETSEQEAARIVSEASAPLADPVSPENADLTIPADLSVWQEDDAETGAKAGDRVTNDHLRTIAAREAIDVESDDNKGDLQRKIVLGRAAHATGGDVAPTVEPAISE